mmetsp:Transcript_38185/g.85240  ORF Transcript_38185/g.85240 Transcript_38185/m.85240 type:complete len:202 (-) Transcript_38185:74-679(-)
MMLILCRLGCRLKTMTSPSLKCRSTVQPGCSAMSEVSRTWRRSYRSSFLIMNLAPGQSSAPRATKACSSDRLYGVTSSGTVRFLATLLGTPTSSRLRLGSAVMTVRAEKSTRLPMRFWRMRPSLPLIRWAMVFKRRPDRCVSCTPEEPLSKKLATRICRIRSVCSVMWAGSPRAIWLSKDLFTFTTLTSTCVRSSCERAPS